MNLYEKWKNSIDEMPDEEYNDFWENYFKKEKTVYEKILSAKENTISGKLSEIAERYGLNLETAAGFISGINSSLVNPVDLEKLEEDSEVTLEIDFEKLYFNMHDAKADWLYNLPEWEEILSAERRKEIEKEYKSSKIVVKGDKIGRNDLCPCGSGKKYKKCCGK